MRWRLVHSLCLCIRSAIRHSNNKREVMLKTWTVWKIQSLPRKRMVFEIAPLLCGKNRIKIVHSGAAPSYVNAGVLNRLRVSAPRNGIEAYLFSDLSSAKPVRSLRVRSASRLPLRKLYTAASWMGRLRGSNETGLNILCRMIYTPFVYN